MLLSLLLLPFVGVFLFNLVIKYLWVGFGKLHFVGDIGITVDFSKPSPDSFLLRHCSKLCVFVEADFFEMSIGFFLEELLILFVDINCFPSLSILKGVFFLPIVTR